MTKLHSLIKYMNDNKNEICYELEYMLSKVKFKTLPERNSLFWNASAFCENLKYIQVS